MTREQVEFWLKNMEKLDLANADNRQRIINTFINSIYVHDDGFVVNFNCREESEVIPRDLEGDVSSLTILGEPDTGKRIVLQVYVADNDLIGDREIKIGAAVSETVKSRSY